MIDSHLGGKIFIEYVIDPFGKTIFSRIYETFVFHSCPPPVASGKSSLSKTPSFGAPLKSPVYQPVIW
jgi:hypothetical protein